MKNFFKIILLLLSIAVCIYIYARFIEPKMLNVNYEIISSEFISSNANDLKILQFSDTHISEYFSIKDLNKLVNKINDENPDIVLFTGDLIDHYNNYRLNVDVSEISEALSHINATLGKYAVYGNHDYGGGAERVYKTIMDNSGFVLLVNDGVEIEEYKLNIIGLDDSIFGKVDIKNISKYFDDEDFNIVLSHEPDVIDLVLEYNIDLFLSGHSHGGQVNLPFASSKMLPSLGKKYVKGLYNFKNSRDTILNVNIGIGTSQIPFRFMAVPELSVLILTNK